MTPDLRARSASHGLMRMGGPLIGLAVVAGCNSPSHVTELDQVPPAGISDLHIAAVSHASVTLAWTASGDDGTVGTATSYDVRVSTQPFDASTWSSAERFESAPVPSTAGTPEILRIPLLIQNSTYYFAIRAQDDFNDSVASEIVMATTHDFGLLYGAGDGLTVPRGIAVDDSGNIYIADTLNNRINKYSRDGRWLRSWGGSGSGLGQFAQPRGIAFGNDMVYVADTYNYRVQMFTRDGEVLFAWGEQGENDGMFRRPVGIAVDPDGNVYVTDVIRERVQRFTPNGHFRFGWGEPGSLAGMLRNPVGIAADAAGNVFVLDQDNERVQVFTREGQFVRRWGRPGAQNGEFVFPSGIAVDADGAVYVTDESRTDFQKFTPRGDWLGSWATNRGPALRPSAIAVAPEGNAYVLYVDATSFSVFGARIPSHPMLGDARESQLHAVPSTAAKADRSPASTAPSSLKSEQML